MPKHRGQKKKAKMREEGGEEDVEKANHQGADISEIRSFVTIEPETIGSVIREGEYEEIELAVDSGATETVVSEDMLQSIRTQEGVASRRGVKYEVANGVRIDNEGEKKMVVTTEKGVMRNITAQVCDVSKPLRGVAKMMRAGHRVVFDEEGSYIEDKTTKETMWLESKNGMFMLKVWAKQASGF